MDTNDEHLSRTNEVTTPENKEKYSKLWTTVKAVNIIFCPNIGVWKNFSKWMLCVLTVKQKQCVDDSENCLKLFIWNEQDFFVSVCDNGWNMNPPLHSKSNQRLLEWKAVGERIPRWPKQKGSGKCLLGCTLYNTTDHLKKKIINSEYYTELMHQLRDEMKKKWSHMTKKMLL